MLHQGHGMATVPARIRLHLLGSFRLEREDDPIHFSTRKVKVLFAFLALHPEPHAREKLAALLWGDSPDEQARRSLRTALAEIRKGLGGILLADRETVQLDPDTPLWVDVRRCEEAAIDDPTATIDLYAGDLLQDFFDDWILQERERLRTLYLDTLLRLAQEARSASEYSRAIGYAQKVLATEQANEKAYQHLIFCLGTTGDRAGALEQFAKCERALEQELGVEPSRETLALVKQIIAELTAAPSREARLTNLPNPLTCFIGRDKERTEIRELIGLHRLVTLSGPGGSGKTRLAIEVAYPLIEAFPRGVWWVELAPLSDPALVPGRVAQALAVHEQAGQSIEQLLVSFLHAKRLLLVLDNCEHLIAACSALAEKLLSACPDLHILTTSQEVLKLAGEWVWRVPSLALPDTLHLHSSEALARFDAVRLFVERATQIKPTWKMREHVQEVVQICRRLDGMPLAIELAAASTRVLSVEQIATRLDDRFRLLTAGSRTALPRHQTLRATIDWSYDLLSPPEQTLLNRLSVFSGGWTLKAVEQVCAGGEIEVDQVLNLLTRLVDKSLVTLDEHEGSPRYRLLETIREYANVKLEESGEANQSRTRHLEFFCTLAEAAEPELKGGAQRIRLARLESEKDNLRAALGFHGADLAKRQRLAGALWRFWYLRGYYNEGQKWLERALEECDDTSTALVAKLFTGAGSMAYSQGNFQMAVEWHKNALTIYRTLPDKLGIAFALISLGAAAVYQSDYAHARLLLEESLNLSREVGDKWHIAAALNNLGFAATYEGDYAHARLLLEECLTLSREVGDKAQIADAFANLGVEEALQGNYIRGSTFLEEGLILAREMEDVRSVALGLHNLGDVARHQGDYVRAVPLLEECLGLAQEIGERWLIALTLDILGLIACQQCDWERARSLLNAALKQSAEIGEKQLVAHCLESMGGLATVLRDPERGALLFGAADELRQAIHAPLPPIERVQYEVHLAALRNQLDETALSSVWEKGREMIMEQAVAYALDQLP